MKALLSFVTIGAFACANVMAQAAAAPAAGQTAGFPDPPGRPERTCTVVTRRPAVGDRPVPPMRRMWRMWRTNDAPGFRATHERR